MGESPIPRMKKKPNPMVTATEMPQSRQKKMVMNILMENSPRNMDTSDNHLQVQCDLQVPKLKADLSKLEKLVRGICGTFKVDEAAIDISIVDDAGIIEVHRKFLQKDKYLGDKMKS